MHAIFKKSTGSSVWASEDKLNALYRAHDHLNTELIQTYNTRPDDDLCEIIRTYIELGFLQLMKMSFEIRFIDPHEIGLSISLTHHCMLLPNKCNKTLKYRN